MLEAIDNLTRSAVEACVATGAGGHETRYQEALAHAAFRALIALDDHRLRPSEPYDLREHSRIIDYGPRIRPGGARGPQCDVFVWRPKVLWEFADCLPVSECVAVEIKTEDADANRGPGRLKWLSYVCPRLGIPSAPRETGGLDYTETESLLIALRAYRELVGVGRAYALLIGPNSHFKLGLLSDHVVLLDESLWNMAGSSGTRYLYAEIETIWPAAERRMS